jgi:PAS domain S-box-containing protein
VAVAVAVVAFTATGGYLRVQTLAAARERTRAGAQFQAGLAAAAVSDGLAFDRMTLSSVVGALPITAILATPDKCRLVYSGPTVFQTGHIDILTPDGRVVCSSLTASGAPRGASHAGEAWVAAAFRTPGTSVSAPFTDRLTGEQAIAVAAVVPGAASRPEAMVAFVLTLSSLARSMTETYGGPRRFAFAVSAGDTLLSGGPVRSGSPVDARAARGRLYGSATITALGWRIDASIDEASALGPTRTTLDRQAWMGLAALLLTIAMLIFVQHRLARPLALLTVAEAEVRQSEERLRLLLDGARDYAIFALGPDGRVVTWSASAELLLGYPEPEILGLPYRAFFTEPEVAAGVPEDALARAAATGRIEVEGPRLRRDGSQFWARSVLTSRPGEHGQPEGFVKVVSDISAQRHAEQTILRMNNDLERRVRERTAELEAQAIQLRAANEELDAFSYSVSHDLRAPVRAMNGLATIVMEDFGDDLPGPVAGYLGQISGEAVRLAQLIDGLLRLSKVQRSAPAAEVLDMNAAVSSAWAALSTERAGRNVEFVVSELPPVLGDQVLLHQVLVNLLGNALKYSRDRDPARIEVGARLLGAGTEYFVTDNGVGFDMRYADKLFQVFQRLHSEQEYSGTGIGLALVHRIVTRHSGSVWGTSMPGHGATFSFTWAQPQGQLASAAIAASAR